MIMTSERGWGERERGSGRTVTGERGKILEWEGD
jgi:hypothetical protein